jgi:hypothetical protein
MFVVGGYGSKQFTFDSQSEIDQLMRKMAMDISFIVRLINPSRIILAQDDTSWRKQIKIDENEGYKGNRVKNKTINWNNVYTSLGEFTEIMESNGMILSKIPTAEADDIMALWAKELAQHQHQHVIIVSGDEDIRQLAGSYWHGEKQSFITVFNPFMQGKNASRKLYVPGNFELWLREAETVDFLRPSFNVDKEDFKKIITAERTKMEVVNGGMIALRKMFCGDDGDNIPAIYSWLNDKGVEVRVTNSKFEKIYEMLEEPVKFSSSKPQLDHIDLLERYDDVLDALKKVIKQNPPFNIKDRILRQVKLVVLDPEYFPEEITQKFNEIKQSQIDLPRVNYANTNMHDLLEGTRYVREKKNENEASIFKQIDRISGKALF